MVPLDEDTVCELSDVIEARREGVRRLAAWRTASPSKADWVLEPPLAAVSVILNASGDLLDVENVARLRRSFDFLAPNSLALRKETAAVVVDALLEVLVRSG